MRLVPALTVPSKRFRPKRLLCLGQGVTAWRHLVLRPFLSRLFFFFFFIFLRRLRMMDRIWIELCFLAEMHDIGVVSVWIFFLFLFSFFKVVYLIIASSASISHQDLHVCYQRVLFICFLSVMKGHKGHGAESACTIPESDASQGAHFQAPMI